MTERVPPIENHPSVLADRPAGISIVDWTGVYLCPVPPDEIDQVCSAVDLVSAHANQWRDNPADFAARVELIRSKGLLFVPHIQARLSEHLSESRVWLKDRNPVADTLFDQIKTSLETGSQETSAFLINGLANWFLSQAVCGNQELEEAGRWIKLLHQNCGDGLTQACLQALHYRTTGKGQLSGYDHILALLELRLRDDKLGSVTRQILTQDLDGRRERESVPSQEPGKTDIYRRTRYLARPLFAGIAVGAALFPCLGIDPISGALVGAYFGHKIEGATTKLPHPNGGRTESGFQAPAVFAAKELTSRLDSLLKNSSLS